jgi:hypothetical protein
VVNIGTGGGKVDVLEELVAKDVVASGPADGLLENDVSG